MRIDYKALAALAVITGLTSLVPPAFGADTKECKADRTCRGLISSRSFKATSLALKALDKCHAKRDAGKFTGDCNALDVTSIVAKTGKKITKKCANSEAVRCLFSDCDPLASIGRAVASAIKETGETVQGSPTLAGDKQRIKCHKAVGKARSSVLLGLLKPIVLNQKLGDADICEFHGLTKPTVAASESVLSPLRAQIARSCGDLTADDIGSCSPFPDCIFDSSEEITADLVVQFFSSPAQCGDGTITPPNEECDDGNDVDEDACSNECRAAVCGDNITQTTEECDDNTLDDDACVDCKASRCGDGALWTVGLPDGVPAEQCDDGNDVANDGCTNCVIDAVSCDPAVGYRVTVAINYDQTQADMNSITVDLRYPEGVSIPGSAQDPSVQQRLTVLGPTPSDFISLGNDRDLLPPAGVDDTLTVGYADLADDLGIPDDGIPSGDQFEVRYDCAEGARFSGDDFTCTVVVATTLANTPVTDAACTVRVSAP